MNKLGILQGAFNILHADNDGNASQNPYDVAPTYISEIPKVHLPKVPDQNNPGHETGWRFNRTTSQSEGIIWITVNGGEWRDCTYNEPAPWLYIDHGHRMGEVFIYCLHNRSNGQPWFTGTIHPTVTAACTPR